MRLMPLLAFALILLPGMLRAQLPVSLAVEARAGYAVPTGDFSGSADTPAFEAGPTFAVGGRLDLLAGVGLFVAYQQSRFGCLTCRSDDLDGSAVLDGMEAGVHLAPMTFAGVTPWLRAAGLVQALSFSGFGEQLYSRNGTGFGIGAGVEVPLAAGLTLAPGIRFQAVPAEFEFSNLPQRSVDVSFFSFDLGVGYRFF